MINFLSQFAFNLLITIIGSIILSVVGYIFRRSILVHFFEFIFWISNKEIELEFSLSIVYDETFNLDLLEGIGQRFSVDGFEVNFMNEHEFIINKKYSYKIIINRNFSNNEPELEDIPYAIEVTPQVSGFSYRSGLNKLCVETSTILRQLSTLGVCQYYMNIILNGKMERIHLEEVNDLIGEVRKNASNISFHNSKSVV